MSGATPSDSPHSGTPSSPTGRATPLESTSDDPGSSKEPRTKKRWWRKEAGLRRLKVTSNPESRDPGGKGDGGRVHPRHVPGITDVLSVQTGAVPFASTNLGTDESFYSGDTVVSVGTRDAGSIGAVTPTRTTDGRRHTGRTGTEFPEWSMNQDRGTQKCRETGRFQRS